MAEALNAAVRQARRAHRIPKTARCADCGIADPVVLQRDGKQWRCYECAKIRRGECPDESHHVLGKDIDPMTANMPGNIHRFLTEEQLAIPEIIRTVHPHNPLAWIIRILCAIRDFGRAILDNLDAAINWLSRLLARLEERFGTAWDKALDLPPLFP
jgi:hypothetical protein